MQQISVKTMHAIILHSVVPVRTEPREQAEQSTQMLFGQTCWVLDKQPRWIRVKCDDDGEEGWCDSKMVTLLKADEWKQLKADGRAVARVQMPMAYAMSENNGQTIPLSLGTTLPNYLEGRFTLLGVGFRIDPSMVAAEPLELNEQNLLGVCRFLLNVPYLWGGKNAMGMDCSGFVQQVMSLFGRSLHRNAKDQAKQGRKVSSLKAVKAGDLCFFNHGGETPVSHVGIAIDGERIIHCSGRVKVEQLTSQGIVSVEQNGLTHDLVSIRRV